MNKGIGIVIGFTKDGVPMRKERLQTHSSEKRPLRRTQGELEFRLPIHPRYHSSKGWRSNCRRRLLLSERYTWSCP